MKRLAGQLLVAVSTPLVIGAVDGLARQIFAGAMLLLYALGMTLLCKDYYEPVEEGDNL